MNGQRPDFPAVSPRNDIGLRANLKGGSEHTIILQASVYESESTYAADIYGDGDTDVISEGEKITWCENTAGSGLVWTEHTIYPSTGGTTDVLASDLDADGDVNVIATEYYQGNVCPNRQFMTLPI